MPETEAPYGWDVIAKSDGRRISRWLSKSAADELAHRVTTQSDEKVNVTPADPMQLRPGLTLEDVKSPTEEKTPEAPVDFSALTVEELDSMAEAWDVDGYPKTGKKDEKVAALTRHAA